MDRPIWIASRIFVEPPICSSSYEPTRSFKTRPAAASATASIVVVGDEAYPAVAINSASTPLRPPGRLSSVAPPAAVAPPALRKAEDARGVTGDLFTGQFSTLTRGALLEELIAVLGQDAAARLVAVYGGTRLYVPQSPSADDAVSNAIGHTAALALGRIYGGDRVDVPNPTPRRTRIVQMRAEGIGVDAIARALGCTRRRVFQVLAEMRASNRVTR
jgi:hypothetical protein